MNLHETAIGQRFFNVQLPALINTLKDIAAALSRPAPSAISFPADPPALCLPTTVSGTKEPKPNLLDMTYCSMTGKTNDHTASKNAAAIHKEDAK